MFEITTDEVLQRYAVQLCDAMMDKLFNDGKVLKNKEVVEK